MLSSFAFCLGQIIWFSIYGRDIKFSFENKFKQKREFIERKILGKEQYRGHVEMAGGMGIPELWGQHAGAIQRRGKERAQGRASGMQEE